VDSGTRSKNTGKTEVYNTQMRQIFEYFTYIWLKFMVNVGKYSIHGAYGTDFALTALSF